MQIFRYTRSEIDHLRMQDRKNRKAIEEIGMVEHQIAPDLFTALVTSVAGVQVFRKGGKRLSGSVWKSGAGQSLNSLLPPLPQW